MTSTPAAVEDALRTLFPAGTAVAAERIRPASVNDLWPEERSAVAGAVPARVNEFVAGRTAARRVLQTLGLSPQALPMAPDRAATWPTGLGASLAHAAGYSIAVARAGAPLGVDIEPDEPIAADLWPIICTPDELLRLTPDIGRRVRRLFCAKEAVFKAQPQGCRAMFGHETVSVTLAEDGFDAQFLTDAGTFRAGQIVRGRIAVLSGLVLVGVAV